ncbi:MAG: phosphodiester glycosidase family protein [Clostridia bacterium]|nr:phosphodiester glycosidase family protein [Clostridia bacterium]
MNDLEYLTSKYLVDDDGAEEPAPKSAPAPKAAPADIPMSARKPVKREAIPLSAQEEQPKASQRREQPRKTTQRAQQQKRTSQQRAKQQRARQNVPQREPDYEPDYNPQPRAKAKKKPNYVGRFFLCLFTLILMVIITVFSACLVISYGPSPTIRNILVLSAKQASATKWVPGLFLSDAAIQEIIDASNSVNTDVVTVDDIATDSDDDEWADAIDGMKLIFRQEPNFKAYVLLIKDPSRVKLGISSENFAGATAGMRIFEIADKYKCVAAINGGEFADPGGQGTGAQPIGITYSDGKCVWGTSTSGTFIGFDKDNKLVCVEGMSTAKGTELGIRDGCCFMYKNVIIERDGDNVKLNYADDNLGIAQKTAIGQRADGTVIMIVTDGRSAESVGATRNDMIDLMVEYGAVTAGSLDGGSSSMLYYRNYYDAYKIDKDGLEEYNQMGLVNRYKAFTKPRRIPTYFIVMPGEES